MKIMVYTRCAITAGLILAAHGALAKTEQQPKPMFQTEELFEYDHEVKTAGDEASEPDIDKMAQLLSSSNKDLSLYFGGKLKNEFFLYNRCSTLREDYSDQNDFFRHKLQLDGGLVQGAKKYGRPASEAAIRLSNYVLWQDTGNYTPMYIEQIALPDANNAVINSNVRVKTIVPLVFVEQAWFKLHFGTFAKPCRGQDTFLKIGYFPYQLGRGITMGMHNDLAVDYLGWGGEGGFTRYPFMPPGILWHQEINKKLSVDAYFNLWHETNASISDTLKPTRRQRLDGSQPERGSGNDTWSLAVRADYTIDHPTGGSALIQPYAMFTRAPEQTIEVFADASSELLTLGTMVDWKKNNVTVNLECALQLGHQDVHALDRNTYKLTAGATGGVSRSFTHIQQIDRSPASSVAGQSFAPAGEVETGDSTSEFDPRDDLSQVVLTQENRSLDAQGKNIKNAAGADLAVRALPGNPNIFNTSTFGNNRFRKAYRLENRGVMLMADAIYDFEEQPVTLAGTVGFISGDRYPYNDENSRVFRGFIPQRSRYRGYGVKNFLIFERQVIPRPLNISHRTLSAYNDVKDLSNLQFLGVGATWFPFSKRSRGHLGLDVMLLGEVAPLKTWDVKGEHPDSKIELQLKRLRNSPQAGAGYGDPTLFSGWETTKDASRFLGYELDIRAHYQLLDHCNLLARMSFFVPGNLYKDVKGQPNIITQRVDKDGFLRYDSLGNSTALAMMIGLHYTF